MQGFKALGMNYEGTKWLLNNNLYNQLTNPSSMVPETLVVTLGKGEHRLGTRKMQDQPFQQQHRFRSTLTGHKK